jgi:hypothetical protein
VNSYENSIVIAMKTKFGKHVNVALTIAMIAGWASQALPRPQGTGAMAQSQKPDHSRATLKAGNRLAGNALSQWVDRTPTISPSPALPKAAEDCAMVYDPVEHRIVLFAGKNDNDQSMNEVWTLDLQHCAWRQIEVEGESPPPREDHVAIYDPIGHRMIVHGGDNGMTLNDTWALDLKTPRWRNMTDTTAPMREDHTAIFDSHGRRMVIFGGRNGDGVDLYDLWALDLDPRSPAYERWQNSTATDQHPSGRRDHVVVYDSLKNRMVIYGGWEKETREHLEDTWAFYFLGSVLAPQAPPKIPGQWKQIKTKKLYPPQRRHAVGVYDAARNWFVICGGMGPEGYFNDVWAFDLTGDVWINITPGPQPRIDHQAIYDPKSQRVILYGGDARLRAKFHDLWELQIQPGVSRESLMPALP